MIADEPLAAIIVPTIETSVTPETVSPPMWWGLTTHTWELIAIGALAFGTLLTAGSAIIAIYAARYANAETTRRVEVARIEIAQANLRAGEANERAARADLARIKIEERLAPRALPNEALDAMRAELQKHAGTALDVLQQGDTPEIYGFRGQLVAAVERSGWKAKAWTVPAGGMLEGVIVASAHDASVADEAAAAALLTQLKSAGVAMREETVARFSRGKEDWPGFVMGPPLDLTKQAGVRLYVGAKPST